MERQSIRFLLVSGEVVTAGQDCGCRNHNGPHWLYINDLWRKRNQELLNGGNVRGFIVEDLARIREKRWYMETRHIVEILQEGGT